MVWSFAALRTPVSAILLTTAICGWPSEPRAGGKPACTATNLELLRRTVPEGYAIYDKLGDKTNFTVWFRCEDRQYDLTTAVHEGAHVVTADINAYPLINGRTVPIVGELKKLFRPGVLAPRFPAASAFVTNYLLPGQASSADHFGFLLNELNAYSHDLNTAVKLRHLAPKGYNVMHRDGLAALMAFTAAYVERARLENKDTWAILQSPRVKQTVATLWTQAEDVMGSSCRVPRYAEEAPEYLAPICAADIRHGLGRLLGRPPLCPVSCLKALADAPRRSHAASARPSPPPN
jgi:hypothetical protein